MKNYIHPIICSITALLLFSSCFKNKDFDISDKTPNPKFICTYLESNAVIANNSTITVDDKIVFTSEGEFGKCGDNFALYTGMPGSIYQPHYQMQGGTDQQTDSIQGLRSNGTLLDTVNGKFTSKPIKYNAPGTYTVYIISSFINKETGEYKSDSAKMIINVIDPSEKNAILTYLQVSNLKAKIAGNARITNDSICFDNVLPENVSRFQRCFFKFKPYNVTITFKGKKITELTEIESLADGDEIITTSFDGSTSIKYKVGIYIYKSRSPLISAASFKNITNGFTFSDNATVVNDSILLSPWPKGTTACDVKISVPYTTDKTFTVTSFPSIITATAQDGLTTKAYKVIKPKTELDAKVIGITLTTKNSFVLKPVGTYGYNCVVTDPIDAKKAIFKVDVNKFAKIEVDSISSNYSNLKPFSSNSTSCNFTNRDTIYFKVTNGSDVNNFFIKLTELK